MYPPLLLPKEVTVTYRCGHTGVELYATDQEAAYHLRTASHFECLGCYLSNWSLRRELAIVRAAADTICVHQVATARPGLRGLFCNNCGTQTFNPEQDTHGPER